jgi:hypothetical protein
MIVAKAVNMARMMNVPIIGIVENYSYLTCPCCNEKIEVFGKTHVDEIAAKYNIPVIARLPIDPKLSALCDASGKAGKQAEEFSSLAEEKLSVLKEGAEAAVLASQSALSVLSETEKRLAALEAALEESVREKKKTTAALQTETELLFRMLQCVNLPQAQKDLMSERYLALQKTLEEN